MYQIVIIKSSYYNKNICILMIRIFHYFKVLFIWFSHAIWLVKSVPQFVLKILYIQDIVYYALSGSSDTNNLARFLSQICRTGKSEENDYFYVQNIKNPVKHL